MKGQALLRALKRLYACNQGEILMSATITLPVELESLLAKKAAARGVNVEQFAIDTLRRVAERPTISELLVDDRAEFAANGRTEEELQPNIESKPAGRPVPKVRRSTHGRVDLSKEREWVRQHRDEYRGQSANRTHRRFG